MFSQLTRELKLTTSSTFKDECTVYDGLSSLRMTNQFAFQKTEGMTNDGALTLADIQVPFFFIFEKDKKVSSYPIKNTESESRKIHCAASFVLSLNSVVSHLSVPYFQT